MTPQLLHSAYHLHKQGSEAHREAALGNCGQNFRLLPQRKSVMHSTVPAG